MKKKQKTIIISASVLVVVCALLAVLVFVIIPKISNPDEGDDTIFVAEGEGIYYNKALMMYPEIEEKNIVSITINNSYGTYSFNTVINEDSGNKRLVLSDYPKLPLDDTMLSYLRVYTLNTQCESNEPLRDCTPETMEAYGLTAEKCTASYTLKFLEDGVEKEHTVYIGNKTLSSAGSYFATVAGRDVIYKIEDELEKGLFCQKEDFVNPLICSVYSEAEVVYEVERIMVGETIIGSTIEKAPFIAIQASRDTSQAETVSIKYSVRYPTNATGVTASSTYVSSTLTSLLVSFTGDKVVEINPSEELYARYGLSSGDTAKLVSIETFDDKQYAFMMSEKITEEDQNSYYYLLTTSNSATDVPLIIRISAQGYEFLESENAIKWVATNSVDAGFTKYINADNEAGEVGVKDMTLISNTNALRGFEDTFTLTYTPHPTDSSKQVLTVTSASGKYTFADDLNATVSSERNQFNNFYAMLVNYPYPNRFNTMTEEEREAIKTEENLIFSLRVTMNDGTLLGYDYYKIDSASVMCEFFDETTYNEETKEYETKVVFDTTVEHIDILANALKQLINGETVDKR